MKGVALALVSSAAIFVDALSLAKRDSPSVLGLPLQKREGIAYQKTHRISKRNTVNVELKQIKSTAYYATVNVGTPPQTVALDVDTGSSDMWVFSPQAEACADGGCSANGVYDLKKSSSVKVLESKLNTSYADGTTARGPFVLDTIKLGGASLDFQFGVASTYSSTVDTPETISGLLGVGYPELEATTTHLYPNLPIALTKAGIIKTPAFSLWLDNLAANKGQILFGGVNKAKYHGNLATLDLVNTGSSPKPTEFFVSLSGLSITDNGNFKGPQDIVPALLDSGTTATYLPEAYLQFIINHFNGSLDSKTGNYVARCSLKESNKTVNFNFGSQVINVPISELLTAADVDPNTNQQLSDEDNNKLCVFEILVASDDSAVILGDSFLRSAYIVYDLINYQVSIANTNFNSTTDDIVEITGDLKGPDVVPGAKTLASVPTAIVTASGLVAPVASQSSMTAISGTNIPVTTSHATVDLKANAAPAAYESLTFNIFLTTLSMLLGTGVFISF